MQTRSVVRAAALAAVPALAAIVVVACSGESPSGVPTIVESATSAGSTVSSSDLTSSDDGAAVEASDDGHSFGPPEEVLAACDQKAETDACSFISPRNGSAVDGTCRARRDDPNQLACLPNDRPGRAGRGEGDGGPPEEALSACDGIATGAECSFESPFGTVDGTCSEGPGGSGQVACRPDWAGERPDGRGPGGGGPGREAARAACADKQAEASCSFEAPFGTISGACRTGRDGSTLVCAPEDGPRQ